METASLRFVINQPEEPWAFGPAKAIK